MAFTDIDGLQIHYEMPAATPIAPMQRIIYVHGTGCNGSVWTEHMTAISSTHAAAAIDLPGHGKSSGAGFRGVADHAYYVAELAARLKWDSYILAGHSLGGGIALAVAMYFPQGLTGLMLIDTGARLRVAPRILQTARKSALGIEQASPDPRQGFATQTAQEVVDKVRDLTADTNPKATYNDWIADDTCDFLSRLGEIDLPCLAICGAEDDLTPLKYHTYFRDHMPNCQLEVINDAAHWSFIEQPQAFNAAILKFLEGV